VNISGDGKVLAAATRELWRRWLEAKTHWRDTKSDEFERQFLAELVAVVERTGPAFDRLDKVVATIREECE
jgi:hypothetical protein